MDRGRHVPGAVPDPGRSRRPEPTATAHVRGVTGPSDAHAGRVGGPTGIRL